MSMEIVRDNYEVPAKRGMYVEVRGVPGIIVSARNKSIRVRTGPKKHVRTLPTDGVVYYAEDRTTVLKSTQRS